MEIGKKILTALGWVWFVIAGLFAASAFGRGDSFAAIVLVASALFALPPLWKKLSTTKFNLALGPRFAGGIVAFLIAVAMNIGSAPRDDDTKVVVGDAEREPTDKSYASTKRMDAVPEQLSDALATFEAKLGKYSIEVMKKKDYPKIHAKLGQSGFDRANSLARWAGITAAMNSKCAPKVDVVAVSDQSTRDEIQWFVDCENGERFQITETMAKVTKEQWTSSTSETAQKAKELKSAPKAQPNSAAVDALDTSDEAVIVGSCDRAVKSAMQSRGSYDPSWSYQYRKHPEKGRVSVGREFEAQNAFGATLSSEYECIVDAKTRDLLSLRIREPTGWETIYSK